MALSFRLCFFLSHLIHTLTHSLPAFQVLLCLGVAHGSVFAGWLVGPYYSLSCIKFVQYSFFILSFLYIDYFLRSVE